VARALHLEKDKEPEADPRASDRKAGYNPAQPRARCKGSKSWTKERQRMAPANAGVTRMRVLRRKTELTGTCRRIPHRRTGKIE